MLKSKQYSINRQALRLTFLLTSLLFAEFCSAQLEESQSARLPQIYINTTVNLSPIKKVLATIRIESEHHNPFESFCGIEYHGNSTLESAKKSFDFELRTNLGEDSTQRILDFAPEEDFVLISNTFDHTHLRNAFATMLWNEMGHYTPQYIHCEVYLNDEYQGLYLLIEKIKIDKNRLNLSVDPINKWSANDPILVILDGWKNGHSYNMWSIEKTYVPCTIVYPKSKKLSSDGKSSIHKALHALESSFTAIPRSDSTLPDYTKLIDLNSLVDFFLMNELGKNPDGFKTSMYIHRDAQLDNTTSSTPFKMGPIWDFDLAFSNVNYENYDKVEGWAFQQRGFRSHFNLIPDWWYYLTCDPLFVNACNKRLTELLELVDEESSIFEIRAMDEYLKSHKERDREKWESVEDETHMTGLISDDTSPENFIAFYKNRMNWMLENIQEIPCISPRTAHYESLATSVTTLENSSEYLTIELPDELLDTRNKGERYSFTPHYSYKILDKEGVELYKERIYSTQLRISLRFRPAGVYFIHVGDFDPFLQPAISAAFSTMSFYYKVIVKE